MGKLKETYTTNDKEPKKTLISKDAYAICEFIEELIKKIEHTRVSLFK